MRKLYCTLKPPLLDNTEQLYFGKDGTAYDVSDTVDSATFSPYINNYLFPYLEYIKKVDGVDGVIVPQSWNVWEYDRTTYKTRLLEIFETCRKAGLSVVPQIWSNNTNLNPLSQHLNILSLCSLYGMEKEACVNRSIIDAVDGVEDAETNDLRGQYPGEGSLLEHWTGSYFTLSSLATPYSGDGQHTFKAYPFSPEAGTSDGAVAILNSANTGLLNRSGSFMYLRNIDEEEFSLPPGCPAAFAWNTAYYPAADETVTYSFVIDTYGANSVKYYWNGRAWTTSSAHIESSGVNWTNTNNVISLSGGNHDFSDDLNQWTSTVAGTSTVTLGEVEGIQNGKAAILTIDGSNNTARISRTLTQYDNTEEFVIRVVAKVNDASASPMLRISGSASIGGGNQTYDYALTENWSTITATIPGRADGSFRIENGADCTDCVITVDEISVVRSYADAFNKDAFKFENVWFETYTGSLDNHYRCTLYMNAAYTGTLSVTDYGVYLCGTEPDVRSYFNPHNGAISYEFTNPFQLLSSAHNWKGSGRLYSPIKGVKDSSQVEITLPNPGNYRIFNFNHFFQSTRAGAISSSNLIYNGGDLYLEDLYDVMSSASDLGTTFDGVALFDSPFGNYIPMTSRYEQLCQASFIRKTLDKVLVEDPSGDYPVILYSKSISACGVPDRFVSPSGGPVNAPMSVIRHRIKTDRGGSTKRLYGTDTGSDLGVYEFYPEFDTPLSSPKPSDFDIFDYQVINPRDIQNQSSRYATKMWTLDVDYRGTYQSVSTQSDEYISWVTPVLDSLSHYAVSGQWEYLSASHRDLYESLSEHVGRATVSFYDCGNPVGLEFFNENTWSFSTQWLPVGVADRINHVSIITNGSFANDTTSWSMDLSGNGTHSVEATGGFDNGKYLSMSVVSSSDTCSIYTTASLYSSASYAQVQFYARVQDAGAKPYLSVIHAESSGSATMVASAVYPTEEWKQYSVWAYGADQLKFSILTTDSSNLGAVFHLDGVSVINKDWKYNAVDVGLGTVLDVYQTFDRDRKVVFYDTDRGAEYKKFAGYQFATDTVRTPPLKAALPLQFSKNYSTIYGGSQETALFSGYDNDAADNIISRRSVDSKGNAIDIAWASSDITASFYVGSIGSTLDLDVYAFDDYDGSIGRIANSTRYLVTIGPGETRVISSSPANALPHRVTQDWRHMWNMLPDFWINNYEPEDLDAYAAIWSGAADMASNMLSHLYQYDMGKSVVTAPTRIVASNEVITIDESTHYTRSSHTFSDGFYQTSADQFFIHEDVRDIPYMVDGYAGSNTSSYRNLFDYELTSSMLILKDNISSSFEVLFAPWVTYDESIIYQNFGYLIPFKKEESEQYKDTVVATLYGLFGSHSLHAFRTVAEAACGLPLIPYKGKIYYAEAVSNKFVIGIEDMYGNQRSVELPGILTPSSTYPLKIRTGLLEQETITNIRDLVGKELYGLSPLSSAFDIYDRVTEPTKVQAISQAIREKGIGLYNTIIGEINAESLNQLGTVYDQLGWGDRTQMYRDLIFLLERIKAQYHDILLLVSMRPSDTLGIRESRLRASLTIKAEPTFDHNMVLYMAGEEWDTDKISASLEVNKDAAETNYPNSLRSRTFGQYQLDRFPEIGMLNTSSVYSHFGGDGLHDRSNYGRSSGINYITMPSSRVWKFKPRFFNKEASEYYGGVLQSDIRPDGGFSPYTLVKYKGNIDIPEDRVSVRRGLYATASSNYGAQDLVNYDIQGASGHSVYFDGSTRYFDYDRQTSSINDLNIRTVVDYDFRSLETNPEDSTSVLSYSPSSGITVLARVQPQGAGVVAELAGLLTWTVTPPPPVIGACCYSTGDYCDENASVYACSNTTEQDCINLNGVWQSGVDCGTDPCDPSENHCIGLVANDDFHCVYGTLDYATCLRDTYYPGYYVIAGCTTCSPSGTGDPGFCCMDNFCFAVEASADCVNMGGEPVTECTTITCPPDLGGWGSGGGGNFAASSGDGNFSLFGFIINNGHSGEMHTQEYEYMPDSHFIDSDGLIQESNPVSRTSQSKFKKN